ncbi:MAG TPA: hypothetical protein VFU63_04455 [Ktedonobacterales bacterium]|nr:hypothetical protein [Ktedonobacterales bacterium]
MRQRIEARQSRAGTAGTNSNWFRVGVLSATALAPLIARWNDLRANNRALNLRELAAARLSDARAARDQAAERLAPVRTAASARLDDARELASARLDDARVLASARLDDALERLAQVRTPEMLQSVPPFSLVRKRAEELQRQRRRRRQQTTLLWTAGVGVGLVAAGVTAYVLIRRRMATAAIEEEGPMVELPHERNLAEATVGKGPAMRNSHATSAEQAEVSVPVHTYATTPGVTTGNQARYIGNIRTMIFHDADDTAHLPAEENRIYFTSVEEARQAGYRHAREMEAPETENQ